MHIGTNHWATAHTTRDDRGNAQVEVLDSLRRRGIHPDVRKLTKQFWPQSSPIARKVQQQKGGTDCGLFAIAMAEAICRAESTTDLRFDQTQMRAHLASCFRKRVLSAFP